MTDTPMRLEGVARLSNPRIIPERITFPHSVANSLSLAMALLKKKNRTSDILRYINNFQRVFFMLKMFSFMSDTIN